MAKVKFKIPVRKVVNPVLRILKMMQANDIVSIESGMIDDQFVKDEATIIIKIRRDVKRKNRTAKKG